MLRVILSFLSLIIVEMLALPIQYKINQRLFINVRIISYNEYSDSVAMEYNI